MTSYTYDRYKALYAEGRVNNAGLYHVASLGLITEEQANEIIGVLSDDDETKIEDE